MNVLRLCISQGTSRILHIPEVIAPCLIHTTAIRTTFWEKEKKSGYKSNVTLPSRKDLIVEGFRELKKEIQLWKDEMKEKLDCDPILVYRPGETDVVFNFKNESAFDTWVVTTDADHREGKSTAKLEMSSAGAGLFHGNVNSEHVRDGIVKRTGYANIRTKRARVRQYKRIHINYIIFNIHCMYFGNFKKCTQLCDFNQI